MQKKTIFTFLVSAIAVSFISIMALQSGLFASLYRIVLKEGNNSYTSENVQGVILYNSPIAEKFLLSEESSQTEWKLEYPSKENNAISSLIFSKEEISSMIESKIVEKNILGQNYGFFINTFPSIGVSPAPKFLFSQFGTSFYIITSNTKEQSINAFINNFTNAIKPKTQNTNISSEEQNTCKTWFDGCNTCAKSTIDSEAVCTKMYCETPGKSVCKEYFTDTQSPTPSIPPSCTIWFDGCNTCTKSENNSYNCTEKSCEVYAKEECQDTIKKDTTIIDGEAVVSSSEEASPSVIVSPVSTISPTPSSKVVYNNKDFITENIKEICIGKHNTLGIFVPACKTGEVKKCDEYTINKEYCYYCGSTKCTTPITASDRPIDGKCAVEQNKCEYGNSVPLETNQKKWKCQGINTGKDSEICTVQNPSLPAVCGENAYECDNGKRVVNNNISNGEDIFWECHNLSGNIITSKDNCALEIPTKASECDENVIYGCLSGTLTKQADLGLYHYWTCSGTDGSEKECSGIKKGIQNADAQCGTEKNECLTGSSHDLAIDDTSLEYRWLCYGIGEGKNVVCKKAK